MKAKSLLTRKVPLAFAGALVSLLILGAVSYRSIILSSESDRRVRHTQEVLAQAQNLLLAVQGSESSYRAFALTGDESYLSSCRAGLSSARTELVSARNLTVDNPEQQRRIPLLARLLDRQAHFRRIRHRPSQ